ncbi:MAG: alkaline phosphatase family protein [Ruthenibacterium sp.]
MEQIDPVFPALTYTCHTSILTGVYAGRHGILHNEVLRRGGQSNAPWHCMKQDVKAPTLLDVAHAHGMTVCSLSWPVSGGADYDMNMPMIVPYHYDGYEPEQYLAGTATENLMQAISAHGAERARPQPGPLHHGACAGYSGRF